MPAGIELFGLEDVGIYEEIPETGSTIKENSYLKAKYVADKIHSQNKDFAVFADDSGLEVEALNNAPGVYSARYAGTPKNESANNEKLLNALAGKNNRNARFVTIITFIANKKTFYFEGVVNGKIQQQAAGSNGFGYDPLFVPEGYNETFAQLSSEAKNAISHRGLAVKKLTDFIKNML